MKILVVGNLVLDLLAWPVENIRWDGTVWVDRFTRSVGGNGANTSYTLAKLGADVTLAGAVGKDREGQELIEILKSVGVNTSRIQKLTLPTPTTMALVRKTGSRAFVHRPGASRGALTKAPSLRGFSHLHVANPFAVPSLRTNARPLLEKARLAGMTTSMDTGWDSKGEWGKVVLPCLEFVDILFVNEEESKLITGAKSWREALRLLPASHVVMKRGAKGAIIDGETIPAYPVEAIDSTGAGDVFAGAFLASWTRGNSLTAAVDFANAAAAMSVLELGSVAGVRNYNQTLRWKKSRQSMI